VLVACAIVVLLLVLAWGFQRRLIYLPDRSTPPPAATVLPSAQDVVLQTEDGLSLGAWYLPAADPQRAMTVLVAPGNGGNRAGRATFASALGERGLGVLLLDYRGYGGNPGSPTESGLAFDARAARAFLLAQGIPPDRILYFGESLGAAVVTELATEHRPAGLLLRSPFTDLASVGRIHYPFLPVGWLLKDRYEVAGRLGSINVPVTVVYGTVDQIVPPEQSRTVASAAATPAHVVEIAGADHNDPALFHGAEVVDAVLELAARANQQS
jgi:uncharacterized protein